MVPTSPSSLKAVFEVAPRARAHGGKVPSASRGGAPPGPTSGVVWRVTSSPRLPPTSHRLRIGRAAAPLPWAFPSGRRKRDREPAEHTGCIHEKHFKILKRKINCEITFWIRFRETKFAISYLILSPRVFKLEENLAMRKQVQRDEEASRWAAESGPAPRSLTDLSTTLHHSSLFPINCCESEPFSCLVIVLK